MEQPVSRKQTYQTRSDPVGRWLQCSRSIIDDAGERNVRLHLLNLHGRLLAGLGIGDDHDVAAVDFRDPIALVADCFNRHLTNLAFVNRRRRAGGGTNIGAGLRAAGDLLEGGGEVILISDGDDDSDGPLVAADELAAEDVRVTGVGVGASRDDERMAAIADATGGTYFRPGETDRLQLLFDTEAAPSDADSLVVDRTHFITDGVETEANPTAVNDVEPRTGARLLVTTSEGDPALTAWRFGLGRVVSVTAYGEDGRLEGFLRSPDAELTTRSVNWVVGDPQRKRTNATEVTDTHRGNETTVVHRGSTRPTAPPVRFVRTGAERFEATLTPTRVGYDSVLGAEYAVNYATEYGAVGRAPPSTRTTTSGRFASSTVRYRHSRRSRSDRRSDAGRRPDTRARDGRPPDH